VFEEATQPTPQVTETQRTNWGAVLPVIGAIAGGLIALWLLLGFRFVGTGERGVLVNKGEVTGRIYDEGWYVITPVVHSLRKFDVKSQLDTVQAAAASSDLQDVFVELGVQFRIDGDAVPEIARTIGTERQLKVKIIDPAVQEVTKASTAKFAVENIIKERPAVKDTIEVGLTERLAPYGVVLEEISIKNITFSEEFTNAIERKQIAEQNRQQAKFEAESTVARAEAKAKEQSLLKQTLTSDLLQRLWIEKWDGKLPTYYGGGTPILDLGLGK